MSPTQPAPLLLRGQRFDAARPAVMGVINRTTDSFYVPARFSTIESAIARADEMLGEGVDIIDVGGVRAGQQGDRVDAATEIDRVRPLLGELRQRHPGVLLSVDTWRARVGRACADRVDLINDAWAGADSELLMVAAESGLGYVVSHTGGLPPRTDPVGIDRRPPDAVVDEVLAGLRSGAERALAAGIPAERIVVDPTLDFGKTTPDSLAIVARTWRLVALGYPVLQAISRKDFVGETLGLPVAERLEGSLAATAVAAWQGATIFRTHDVRATRRVIDMVATLRGDRPPACSERGR